MSSTCGFLLQFARFWTPRHQFCETERLSFRLGSLAILPFPASEMIYFLAMMSEKMDETDCNAERGRERERSGRSVPEVVVLLPRVSTLKAFDSGETVWATRHVTCMAVWTLGSPSAVPKPSTLLVRPTLLLPCCMAFLPSPCCPSSSCSKRLNLPNSPPQS